MSFVMQNSLITEGSCISLGWASVEFSSRVGWAFLPVEVSSDRNVK